MTKNQIEEYLYEHIPITKHLGVKAEAFSLDGISFTAPLVNNINHRSTAFGGSISSLLITTGWSYLRLLFYVFPVTPTIVISKSSTEFLESINSDFTAELVMPNTETVKKFIEMFERFGKGRITIKAFIKEKETVKAEFEGDYVVLKK